MHYIYSTVISSIAAVCIERRKVYENIIGCVAVKFYFHFFFGICVFLRSAAHREDIWIEFVNNIVWNSSHLVSYSISTTRITIALALN